MISIPFPGEQRSGVFAGRIIILIRFAGIKAGGSLRMVSAGPGPEVQAQPFIMLAGSFARPCRLNWKRRRQARWAKKIEERGKSKMAKGTVKWFNDAKGFGFITPDDGGKDLFVHHSAIQGSGFHSLSEGDKVEYEAQQGQKGPQAGNVRKVS